MTTELLLEQIADWIFEQSEPEAYTLHFGIWDAGHSPYTMYATLHRRYDWPQNKPDELVAGESSYGSDTAAEALQALLKELQERN